MPTNMYGPGDNYHATNSNVIPALLRRFHEAKLSGAAEVVIWGSGTPRREFLYSDDLADACLFLMTLDDARYSTLLGSRDPDEFVPPLVNIGYGSDVTIRERSEEHTSELQSLMHTSYAAFCLKKKKRYTRV